MSTFSRKKYQKLAPEKSPGVPLCRDSLRFFNSASWASDTKNLFTLVPRRCTEIFLMGQYRKQRTKWIPAFAGMTGYARGESPGNWQGIFIKWTLNMRQHLQCHNMSLPIAPFPKGKGGGMVGVGD
jgi:hypothetical protein